MPKINMVKCIVGFLMVLVMLPAIALSQPVKRNWSRTIELQDRREKGITPVVAKVTFVAFTMTEPTSPGQPIVGMEDQGVIKVDPLKFPGIEAGYIKFKITKIDWSPMGKDYDGSSDYKVIVRNVWVDMSPQIYIETKKKGATVNLRKRYITAPNVEYVLGDSLPPPTIFKVDKNSSYTFVVGVKAVTPKTVEERPFQFSFNFSVDGLVNSIAVEEVKVETLVAPPVVQVVKAEKPTSDFEFDAAVKRAIDEERVDDLMELMREHPEFTSVRDARAYLALKMTKELVDSSTYRVDISYAKFTRAAPTEKDVNLIFSRFGVSLGDKALNPVWRDGKLYVRPPKDSIDYQVTAIHKFTPENKASIILNSVRDYITFSYKDAPDDKVEIKVAGGHGPYVLYMQRLSGVDYFGTEGAITIVGDTVLKKEQMASAFKLSEEGDFRLFLVDAEQLKKTGSGLVHIVPPPPIPPIVWYIALGLLAVFFFIFLLYRREKRRKDEELEKLLEARGGSDPRVKRKPRPELQNFWKETAISELSLHKNFVREVSNYLKERPHINSDKPLVEGVLLGTVLKFDFENEQYEVRLDRFRALDPKPIDYYEERGDDDKWAQIREVAQDHRDLVKIGWLQVAEGRPMRLTKLEQQFQDEQFSELFQLLLKIDIVDGKKLCGFFTRTTSGKINDVGDRLEGIDEWLVWDDLEDAGYYESTPKIVQEDGHGGKIKVKMKGPETA
jgi:hypothetical protein